MPLKTSENTGAHTESNVTVHLSYVNLQKIYLYILSKTHLRGAIVHRAPEPIIEKLANTERGASHRLAVRLDRSTVWLDHLATKKKTYKKGCILPFCTLSFCIILKEHVITIQKIYGTIFNLLSLIVEPWFQKSK